MLQLSKMDIVYSEEHKRRAAKTELCGGELIAPFECPARAEIIRARCLERKLGAFLSPKVYHNLPENVHSAEYTQFLATCWTQWQKAGFKGEAIATCWPSRAMPRQRAPVNIDGRLGFYALAADTSISEGTYEAAQSAAAVAATAADWLADGRRAAFALCRPPGHHAATDMFGGYCFFNNAAIAAQQLLNRGAKRVAIIDVDFHHGNGTQEIFYQRDDVLFLSIHGEPENAFPYFLGYANEEGAGAGLGYNQNYPLPPKTDFNLWREALQAALKRVIQYAPDFIVISLGVDTFFADPISFFKLKSDDFYTYGEDLARLNINALFVMEGGYAIKEIGINTVNVLEGFENI